MNGLSEHLTKGYQTVKNDSESQLPQTSQESHGFSKGLAVMLTIFILVVGMVCITTPSGTSRSIIQSGSFQIKTGSLNQGPDTKADKENVATKSIEDSTQTMDAGDMLVFGEMSPSAQANDPVNGMSYSLLKPESTVAGSILRSNVYLACAYDKGSSGFTIVGKSKTGSLFNMEVKSMEGCIKKADDATKKLTAQVVVMTCTYSVICVPKDDWCTIYDISWEASTDEGKDGKDKDGKGKDKPGKGKDKDGKDKPGKKVKDGAVAVNDISSVSAIHPVLNLVESGIVVAPEPKVSALAGLVYQGGRLIKNINVIPIYYNQNCAFQTELNQFYADLVTSSYMGFFTVNYNAGGYSFGAGTRGNPFVDSGPYRQSIKDSEVRTYVTNLIGRVPGPTDDTIYAVHFPKNVVISLGNALSCQNFCGYHGAFSSNGKTVYYMVMPDFSTSGCRCGGASLASYTSVVSHEVSEFVTDPDVNYRTLGWYDWADGNAGGEIGDICAWNSVATVVNGRSYTIQKLWSNKQGACIDPTTAACFAGSMTVMMEDGSDKLISEVVVGDRILAADNKGKLQYSTVITLPHLPNKKSAVFINVVTTSGASLKLTAEHFIPAGSCVTGELSVMRAGDVVKGMCIRTVQGLEEVESLDNVVDNGVYVVITQAELIVVNGVVASPYAFSHVASHVFFGVHRLLYYVAPSLMKSEYFLKAQEEFLSGLGQVAFSFFPKGLQVSWYKVLGASTTVVTGLEDSIRAVL